MLHSTTIRLIYVHQLEYPLIYYSCGQISMVGSGVTMGSLGSKRSFSLKMLSTCPTEYIALTNRLIHMQSAFDPLYLSPMGS